MKMFANILKTDTYNPQFSEIQEVVRKLNGASTYELKLAYNHNHDDAGKFSTAEHSASRSGASDVSRSTAYGVKGSKHKAMTNPKISASGKKETGIHREHIDRMQADDEKHKAPVVREVHDALYQHREGEGKKAQAVKVSRKVLAGRETTNRLDYDNANHVSAETAGHLLTGLKTGKNVTVFQSHALDKNADQKHRMITQNIDGKAFKNIDELHTHLENHGLGDAIVHKTEDGGYRVMHNMTNGNHKDGTKAGKAKQRKVMEFRRSMNKDHVSTDHHAGDRKTYKEAHQKAELAKFAAANPDHEVSKAYKAHIGAA